MTQTFQDTPENLNNAVPDPLLNDSPHSSKRKWIVISAIALTFVFISIILFINRAFLSKTTQQPPATEQRIPITAPTPTSTTISSTSIPSVNLAPNKHVYTLEINDEIDSTNGLLVGKISKLFYQSHPDIYDFLSFFPSFSPKNESTSSLGFHIDVQNTVRGICKPILMPDPVLWGSSKILGVNVYPHIFGEIQQWIKTPNRLAYLLMEETAHQWSTNIGKPATPPPPGTPPDGINPSCLSTTTPLQLDEEPTHWSKGLQMPTQNFGAMREARPWVASNDGTFSIDWKLISNDAPRKFHPFDLYLMGLADKSEITGRYLLLSNMEQVVVTNELIKVRANSQKITVDEVISIAGEERNPNPKTAQKNFSMAFIILTKPGEKPSSEFVQAVTAAANAFPNQWAFATDNKSTMNK